MFGLLTKILPLVLTLVPMVERLLGAGSGGEKRNTVIDLIIPVVRAYESISGRELVDEVALAEAIGGLVDGVVGVINLFGMFKDDVAPQ